MFSHDLETSTSLIILTFHLVAERVPSARGALLLEAILDRAPGQTIQVIAAAVLTLRHVTIFGTVRGRGLIELDFAATAEDMILVVAVAEEAATLAAARVAVAGAAHDVA